MVVIFRGSYFMIPLHHRIKDLRKETGKSQEQIAELLGISQEAYSKIETGSSTLSLKSSSEIKPVLQNKCRLAGYR